MTSVVTISKFIPTGGIVTSRKIRNGANVSLYVHALAGANLYSAVSGVECGFPDGRSAFNMSCLDVNTTEANVGFSQYDGVGVTVFSVPAATSFRYVADITNWTNRSTAATRAKAQIGLMATAHATFATLIGTGPQVSGQSAIYVEFANDRMKLVFGATSSGWVAIPTSLASFSIRIEYLAGKVAVLYLNNRHVAQINTTTATTAMQLFARAGHLAAYTAATDAPIRFELDAVSVAIDKG